MQEPALPRRAAVPVSRPTGSFLRQLAWGVPCTPAPVARHSPFQSWADMVGALHDLYWTFLWS